MTIEDRLRKDEENNKCYIDITDIVNDLFGEIAKKIEITSYYDYTNELSTEAIEKLLSGLKSDIKKSEINFYAKTVIITLKNDEKIEILSSEFGKIRFLNRC